MIPIEQAREELYIEFATGPGKHFWDDSRWPEGKARWNKPDFQRSIDGEYEAYLQRELLSERTKNIELKETLRTIGNEAGAPTTGYSTAIEHEELIGRMNHIAALISGALNGNLPKAKEGKE